MTLCAARAESALAARFAAAAASYDAHAGVQDRLAAAVAARCADATPPRRVLEIGCGTGLLTRRLVAALPGAAIVASDVAGRMVEQARARLAGDADVRWLVADAMAVRPDPERPFDLVVSSAAMHWIHPFAAAVRHVSGLLAPGGRFVCGMMVAGTLAELHVARAAACPGKPWPFALPDPDDAHAATRAAGFQVSECTVESVVTEHPSAADLLWQLHRTGVTVPPPGHPHVLLGAGDLRRLIAEYDARFRTAAGTVAASWQLLYLQGQRPQEP